MFTIKVDRNGFIVFRHFTNRREMGEGVHAERNKGHTVLAMFWDEESWA